MNKQLQFNTNQQYFVTSNFYIQLYLQTVHAFPFPSTDIGKYEFQIKFPHHFVNTNKKPHCNCLELGE